MKTKSLTALSITCLFLMQSCFMRYGFYTDCDYTPLTTEKYENTTGIVDLYFEGTPVERAYTQIGLIEVVGEKYADNGKLLAYLKNSAVENGADAVISIKKQYKMREKGIIIDPEKIDYYSATVFTGIAIKYKDKTNIDSLQTLIADTSYKQIVRKDIEKTGNSFMVDFIFSIVLTVAIAVGVVSQTN